MQKRPDRFVTVADFISQIESTSVWSNLTEAEGIVNDSLV
jgi:hypothetical protein